MLIESTLEDMKNDYNWKEVFGYGQPTRVLGDDVTSTDSFDLEDVEVILGSYNGENDGDTWIAVGQLKDRRYFFIEAGCDYTGWG